MSFLQQQPQKMLFIDYEACVIPSSADSSNTYSHCTRDLEENTPACSF